MMKSLRKCLALGLVASAIMSSQNSPSSPPVAPRVEHREVRHGATVIDDYFWLREKSNPKVVQYLEAENAYTAADDEGPAALQRRALQGDARPHQADRSDGAHAARRLPLLLAHRGRQAVSHPVPPQRQHGGAGGSPARPQRAGQGPASSSALGAFEVSDDQNLLAYTIDYHRLPPVLAASEGSAHRATAARHHRARHVASNGPRTTRRSSLSPRTPSPSAATSCGGTCWDGRSSSRSTTRRTNSTTSASARRATRSICFCRSRPRTPAKSATCARDQPQGQFRGLSAAREEAPLLRRSSRRPVLHSHQQDRQELLDGDRAGERSVSEELEGSSSRIATTSGIEDIDLFKDFAVSVEKSNALEPAARPRFQDRAVERCRLSGARLFRLSERHAGLRFARPTATATRA